MDSKQCFWEICVGAISGYLGIWVWGSGGDQGIRGSGDLGIWGSGDLGIWGSGDLGMASGASRASGASGLTTSNPRIQGKWGKKWHMSSRNGLLEFIIGFSRFRGNNSNRAGPALGSTRAGGKDAED